jgi:uncharacterized protein (DUF427 family)
MRHLEIVHRGVTIAETRRGLRTLETSHPPTYYFPPDDVSAAVLPGDRENSFCEWKGYAQSLDVIVGRERLVAAAWTYPAPTAPFEPLQGYIAFYAAPFDACFVDGETVTPQPDGFYGGWITSDLAGPFKGIAGSRFW